MGDPRGFLKHRREKEPDRPIAERVTDWREVSLPPSTEALRTQASRCMDCGVPFCHQGCPLGNLIPDWNELAYAGKMDEAARRLHATNNFPEITGRVCPAPCEASCVLNLEGTPVTIKMIEHAIGDHVLSQPLVPVVAHARSHKRVAVVGSGPAGLACAQELARAGHDVTVFERDDRVGGLLRYGIPDFKMEKTILDRRVEQMQAEGVRFQTGVSPEAADLAKFDATVLAIGARAPRDLRVPGRELDGVRFAMDFLAQQNRRVAGDAALAEGAILATGKHVVVIGGGDTGSDCVGTSIRQGAASVTQLELMPKPPLVRVPENPWPEWPLVLRTSSSHDEGANRDWAISTKAFRGNGGRVVVLAAARVRLAGGRIEELPDGALEIPCELALLAMGFVGPEKPGLVEALGVALDPRGNVVSDAAGRTSVPGIFAAGDASRGQSLVVWAIADGRRVARGVDAVLEIGMATLHESLVAALIALALAGCARDAPTAQKDPAPPAVQKHGLALGAPIPAGAPTVALADVARNPGAYKGKSITTTGTVTAVCQHMGCWMEIKDDASQAHIKMAGHDFFVPKTASGHKATIAATIVPGADDEEAECNQEAQKQMGHAVAKLQLEATGVELD